MSSSIDYRAAWKDYRRRRLIAGVVGVGGLAVVWLVVGVFNLSNSARAEVGIAYLVAGALAATNQALFPCPRCGRTMGHGLNARRFVWGCKHCEIRIGDEPSGSGDAAKT